MTRENFLIINLVCAAIFFLWFLSSRKGKKLKPTRLNLRAGEASEEAKKKRISVVSHSYVRPARKAPPKVESEGSEARAKDLNVMFIFNGHNFDAYEVLGLPAGSSLAEVTKKYQESILKGDAGQIAFFEAAFQAILHKK